MRDLSRRRLTRRRFIIACILSGSIFSGLAGCVSTSQRGDRAFKSGHYNEALDHYERAMAAGEHTPELYTSAAQAALRIGDFTLAERYYSQALRYGGGEAVARELAEFYIATSNYAKAVPVLQSILETTDRPQTVFNNLGAALMYAGSPLNAESYLMVAQQMDPSDPVPYVNLGVLYEKHLNNPRLAYGFYKCFLKLSADSRQRGKVRARVTALEVRFKNDFPSRYAVACGEPYQPAEAPSQEEMKREVARRLADETAELEAKPSESPIDASPDSDADSDAPDADAQPIIIDRMVTEPPPQSQTSDTAGADRLESHQVLSLAEKAFAHHNYQEVVRLIEELPATSLDAHAMALYGRSLVALQEYDEAQRWLAAAVAESPNPVVVGALWTVYRELGDKDRALDLCHRFQDDEQYRELLRECDALQPGDGAPPATRE
jgi:tetratricopeptide (TPR) repeat protein